MFVGLLHILVFPGMLFLICFSMVLAYMDRRIYARLQNRKGPKWYQPLADFLKLLGKESIVPEHAYRQIFLAAPLVAFAAVVTAYFYIPLWSSSALYQFKGDLIVVLYLLIIPTLCFSLGGWYSTSAYATLGSVRALTQLFSYEVSLYMAFLSPALLANSWSISEISAYYIQHPLYILINLPAFAVAILACQGKLERVPFDLPEAETELVSGPFVEYSGLHYAIFRLSQDCQMTVVISLLVAVFIPIHFAIPFFDFFLYLLKVVFILFIMCILRTVMARIRIDQMMNFCWKYLAPVAMLQIIVNLLLKGVLV